MLYYLCSMKTLNGIFCGKLTTFLMLCSMLGIVVDREGEDCAAVADVMNTYYGYGSLPIGLERNGVKDPHVFIDYRGLYKHKTAQGDLMFSRTVNDISWTDVHPIKQVYMTYNCHTGQKMWDPLAVIQAVEGDALFTLSERGIVSLTQHFRKTCRKKPSGSV